MRILGVDPGLRTTGYGVVEIARRGRVALVEAGIITPRPRGPLEQRLRELHDGIAEVIAASRPAWMVIEALWSGPTNRSTAILMAHARGVLCLAACEHGVEVRHLGHSLVKRALVGTGAATKSQVRRMVMEQLRLASTPEPHDVSDALALALAAANIDAQQRRFAALGVVAAR